MLDENMKQRAVGEEISLKDIVESLKHEWKLIAFLGVMGLLLSAIYVARMPQKYEASWQLQMAHLGAVNSEEPTVLIQRLRLPTAYPVEMRRGCGITEDEVVGDYLSGRLEIQPTPNVLTTVDMKFRAASSAQAKQCAEAIVAMVVEQQRSLVEAQRSLLEEDFAARQKKITKYQYALAEELQQLGKIKNLELAGVAYLAWLDQISWLRHKIREGQEEVPPAQMYQAKLIAPIYAPENSVPSKVGQVLLLGMLFGLLLGVLYALGRDGWRRQQ